MDDLVRRIAALRLQNDNAYRERNQLVALTCRLALALGLTAGVKKDADPSKAPFSTVVYFDLPSGQCGFHIPDWDMDLFEGLPVYDKLYDGHSTTTKYERCQNPGLPASRAQTMDWWGLEFPEPYNLFNEHNRED